MKTKYLSVSEMIEIEQEANASGFTYSKMMENAGRNLAEVVHEYFQDLDEKKVLGLVGTGNNGGDTLVALSFLIEWGWKGSAYLVGERDLEDALVVRFREKGGELFGYHQDEDRNILNKRLMESAVLLDGVLGTGIKLPVRGGPAKVLGSVKEFLMTSDDPAFVVAVDCPSGVDCDSGEVAEVSIPADLTITMVGIKHGLLKLPAFDHLGELITVGIGFPKDGEAYQAYRKIRNEVVDADFTAEVLPLRPSDSHKGTFGTALIIAGSINYPGAVLLAGESAYRVGGGLVTLAVPDIIQNSLVGSLPEATWLPLPSKEGGIDVRAGEIVSSQLKDSDAVLIGPGFGLRSSTKQFLKELFPINVAMENLPNMVFDADGLKLLSGIDDWHNRIKKESILTPHPGEMSVLTGMSIKEIQANRLETAKEYSQKWEHVIVLKGAFTVIASPNGEAKVVPVASPSLARAGTGDVLAGIIVGLLAQGVSPFDSACAGAWIHAQAGLFSEELLGNSASVIASDLIEAIPVILEGVLE